MHAKWWKESVVYQIYPRSFMDSNGDGIGDLQGIISKLDYLQELGVDVVWLSPIYQSPNDDNGYDISDYQEIMDEYGTFQDWEELLAGLHNRGMRLIMDLVVNHTSDEHRWFRESRSSKENQYRDYYIWKKGKGEKEPNNWLSFFSGSAWEYDEQTDEYYLHLFSKKQPDLNWENPKLRKEIYEMMTWWLDKGIDGFRMDVINLISKVQSFPDADPENDHPYQWGGKYFFNGPRVHEYLQEMHREVLSKYDLLTVGETLGVSPEEALLFVGNERSELGMLFQFELMDIDSGAGGKWDLKPWKLPELKKIMSKWQSGLKGNGWNSLYLNNHDQPRLVSRFGDDRHFRVESAKMLATMLHTLQGTPFIYQGEELGMTNVRYQSIEDYRDIETLNMYREAVNNGQEPGKVMQAIYAKGRDNSRTPMQWSDGQHAGFTTGAPWLAINPNYKSINVEDARRDSDSIFNYYKKLIQLRKQNPIMVYGDYQLLLEEHENIYAYQRKWHDERLLVILNFSQEPVYFHLPKTVRYNTSSLLISNYELEEKHSIDRFKVRSYEARVYRLT